MGAGQDRGSAGTDGPQAGPKAGVDRIDYILCNAPYTPHAQKLLARVGDDVRVVPVRTDQEWRRKQVRRVPWVIFNHCNDLPGSSMTKVMELYNTISRMITGWQIHHRAYIVWEPCVPGYSVAQDGG